MQSETWERKNGKKRKEKGRKGEKRRFKEEGREGEKRGICCEKNRKLEILRRKTASLDLVNDLIFQIL